MKTIAQQLNIKKFPFTIKDNNGNETYYEDSFGYWVKKEYDKKSNRTYYERSSGYWSKIEYDVNGNEVYYENSNGKLIDNRTVEQFKDRIKQIINLPGDDLTDGEILDMIIDIL